ncbi:MAG: FMN-binding protein [Treponema sp.]|jgi:major membrane immunogen (membrane-anchored lipoprotein)|nr:FMN-binding protein [Treponema sp.]
MNRNSVFCLRAVCLAALLSVSCGKSAYQDGTYTGVSSPDDTGAYGEVTITVSGGKISRCDFLTWQKNGGVKDENYGKVNGEISNADYYAKAQLAVRAMDQYARDLVEKQALNKIDAVSGATIAYNQFTEAVSEALGKAK